MTVWPNGELAAITDEALVFFSLSKIFWLLFQPLSIALLLAALTAFFAWRGWRRLTTAFASGGVIVLFLCSFTTLGVVLLAPLEQRFAVPAEMPAHVDGIVVLGGYTEGEVNASRKGIELNGAANRIVETMRLSRLYPQARIVVSGGEGSFFAESEPDAITTKRLMDDMGFGDRQILYESASRNTAENAALSREIAGPKPGETWLLVTSAFHMPRAVGCFRKAGFPVTPWPVNFKTSPGTRFALHLQSPETAMSRTATGMREWIGLLSYWLSGKTDALLPAL